MVTAGSLYRATYNVYSASGVLTNPTTASLTIVKPDGTAVSPAPAITLPPAQTGMLFYDYLTVDAGRHTGFWVTTTPTTTKDFVFEVTSSVSAGLISITDIKKHLNKDPAKTTDDDELAELVRVATEIVESKVGSVIVRTIVDERHDDARCLWLRHLPVISVTSIGSYLGGGATFTTAQVRADGESGRVERLDRGFFIGGPFAVTYQTGTPVVSSAVLQGAREIVRHLWETQRGGTIQLGAGPGPDSGEDEMFVVQGREYTVPRRVLELLSPDTLPPRVA